MLGISVYFKDLDYSYLEKASEIGAKYVFTSLHIPEEDLSQLNTEMPRFLEKLEALKLELIPDVSPVTFEKLGIEQHNYQALRNLGFTSLRLDYGFEDYNVVKKLQKDFTLVLNASIVDEAYIVGAKEAGVDLQKISVLHNFYPKPETGLSIDYFARLNKVFLEHNIKVMAFVPGDKLKRFPLFSGLPTVEKHRHVSPYVAAVELIKDYGITDIIIGDSKAHIMTLKAIEDYMKNSVITLPVIFTNSYKEMYDSIYSVRRDNAESVVRLATPRIPNIDIDSNNVRNKGSITIENYLSGRYSGEIQITKRTLQANANTNVIGFVHPDYLGLIDSIDGKTKVKFVRIEG